MASLFAMRQSHFSRLSLCKQGGVLDGPTIPRPLRVMNMTWWAAPVLMSKVGDGEIDNYLGHLVTDVDMVSPGKHRSLPREVAEGLEMC